MTFLRVLFTRIRSLISPPGTRIDDEISSHLAMLTADFERRGLTPETARLEARRQFGAPAQIAESWRQQRSLPVLETFARDLRYALRQLRANPAFASAAVLTLALGIGANTAIFRVLDAVVLRSLPVSQPESLVLLQGYHNRKPMNFSYPLFQEMARRQQSVESMFASADFPVQTAVSAGQSLSDVHGRLATGSYFHTLGVNAILGRVFTIDDDRASAPAVAVISHTFWQRAFGGRADSLGHAIQINQAELTIIGVAPPEFFGERIGAAPDVWVPMSLSSGVWTSALNSAGMAVLAPMARLRPDVSISQAQAALTSLYNQLKDLSTRSLGTTDYRVELLPGSQGLRGLQEQFSAPLRVLMAIVALVMLIGCCNLANLLLARATARTHEMGVRLALGAARGRLIRQLLTESLVLAACGSLAGFALALWGSHQLIELASAGETWRITMDAGWRAPLFTALVSIAAICIFGLAPAFAATSLDVHAALQSTSRLPGSGRPGKRAARLLVVAQVSVSLLLISGASLLVRSFWNLLHQDFGYRQEGVLMVQMHMDLAALRFSKDLPLPQMYERFNAIPGVQSAALAGLGPLTPIQSPASIALPERPPQEGEDAHRVSVSPRYFESMGIPIVAGRPITGDDRPETQRVAVISETAARRLFGAADPIGRYFTAGLRFDAKQTTQIVGVARDIRFSGPRDPFGMVVYLSLSQSPAPLSSVVLRTAGEPALFAAAARQALQETAPRLKIEAIAPLAGILDSMLRQERLMALLSGAFGLLALVLAGVGLYGVVAYAVERRTQEIGVRLTLGASRSQVSALLMGEVFGVLAIGLALGIGATVIAGRWVQSVLFGLTPHDPAMLFVAVVLLSVIAAVAGYLPARRAARLDPMEALRQE